jgi:hypothetical protein
MSLTCYTKDDLVICVPVTFDPESDVTSLDGGTVEAVAAPIDGSTVVAADYAEITGPEEIKVAWNDLALAVGVYDLQIRATVAGQTRTLVAERLTVKRSAG